MDEIIIKSWARNMQDYNGKELKEVVHVILNEAEKAMGWGDLKRAVKMNLKDTSSFEEEVEEATPLLDAIENGKH